MGSYQNTNMLTNSTQQVVPVHKDSILFDTNPLRIASYDNPNLPDPFQEQEKLLSSIPEPSPFPSFDYLVHRMHILVQPVHILVHRMNILVHRMHLVHRSSSPSGAHLLSNQMDI